MSTEKSIDKQTDRLNVLKKVQQAIEKRMDTDSITAYVVVAKEYGQKYNIESLVDDWIMEGRTVFSTSESATLWAKSLP